MDAAPKYEIIKSIAVLSTEKSGWTKELNLVSWNEGPAKYDIRDWAPDHEHMSRGTERHLSTTSAPGLLTIRRWGRE